LSHSAEIFWSVF